MYNIYHGFEEYMQYNILAEECLHKYNPGGLRPSGYISVNILRQYNYIAYTLKNHDIYDIYYIYYDYIFPIHSAVRLFFVYSK